MVINDNMKVDIEPPTKLTKGKHLFFWKVKAGEVTPTNVREMVCMNEVTGASLHDFALTLAGGCHKALVTAAANRERWGDVAQREMLEHFNRYYSACTVLCGQIKGETRLPMPTDGPEAIEDTLPITVSEDGLEAKLDPDSDLSPAAAKQKLSMLEGAVITWITQIKEILRQSPEDTRVDELDGSVEHLTPDQEVAYWAVRASHFNDIWDQINSPRMTRVLDYLNLEQSTYAVLFQQTMRDVHANREEANDNLKYLQTLSKWFNKLNEQDDFKGLVGLFKPIVHTILLIWKNSEHYNKPTRLVVLVRMICNAIVNQANKYVSGSEAIFGFLEDEDFAHAVQTLKVTLEVCGAFKVTFFDFRDMCADECPANPWDVSPAALFVRLNALMERCMEMLEMCETYANFFKLDKMVEGVGQQGGLGGTKGGPLTETVRDVYACFKHAVETLKARPYDLLDITQGDAFDADYGSFKQTIKELERRLAAVIHLAFLDRTTPVAKFKLFDSFDSLVKRPIIEDDLEQKYVAVVNETLAALNATNACFVRYRESPPVNATLPNQPPVAGALGWCAGLRQRMGAPMAKFRELDRTILEREEAKEVLKVAAQLELTLEEFTEQKREEWRRDVAATSQAKLDLPLLIRHPKTRQHGGFLEVNFAPELVRVLREAKYFLSLGLEIPEQAQQMYRNVDVFRVWCEDLDMIVGLNNEILEGLLPVEKPLLKPYMDKFDAAVEAGITTLCWVSDGLDAFVATCMELVRTAHTIYEHLKHNLKEAKEVIGHWSEAPMVERSLRPTDTKEFVQLQKNPQTKVYALVKEASKELANLLKHTHHELHLGNTDPTYMAYVNFTNNLVVTGLAAVLSKSLAYLYEQVDADCIKEKGSQPLVIVRLDLTGDEVLFSPSVGRFGNGKGVRDAVDKIIGAVMNVGHLMRRFQPGPEGGYIREVSSCV